MKAGCQRERQEHWLPGEVILFLSVCRCLSAKDLSWTLRPTGQKAVQSGTAILLCLCGNYCIFNNKSNAAQCPFPSQVKRLRRETAAQQRGLPRQFCRSAGSQHTCGSTCWFLHMSILRTCPLRVQPSKGFVFSCPGGDVHRHKWDGEILFWSESPCHDYKSKLM